MKGMIEMIEVIGKGWSSGARHAMWVIAVIVKIGMGVSCVTGDGTGTGTKGMVVEGVGGEGERLLRNAIKNEYKVQFHVMFEPEYEEGEGDGDGGNGGKEALVVAKRTSGGEEEEPEEPEETYEIEEGPVKKVGFEIGVTDDTAAVTVPKEGGKVAKILTVGVRVVYRVYPGEVVDGKRYKEGVYDVRGTRKALAVWMADADREKKTLEREVDRGIERAIYEWMYDNWSDNGKETFEGKEKKKVADAMGMVREEEARELISGIGKYVYSSLGVVLSDEEKTSDNASSIYWDRVETNIQRYVGGDKIGKDSIARVYDADDMMERVMVDGRATEDSRKKASRMLEIEMPMMRELGVMRDYMTGLMDRQNEKSYVQTTDDGVGNMFAPLKVNEMMQYAGITIYNRTYKRTAGEYYNDVRHGFINDILEVGIYGASSVALLGLGVVGEGAGYLLTQLKGLGSRLSKSIGARADIVLKQAERRRVVCTRSNSPMSLDGKCTLSNEARLRGHAKARASKIKTRIERAENEWIAAAMKHEKEIEELLSRPEILKRIEQLVPYMSKDKRVLEVCRAFMSEMTSLLPAVSNGRRGEYYYFDRTKQWIDQLLEAVKVGITIARETEKVSKNLLTERDPVRVLRALEIYSQGALSHADFKKLMEPVLRRRTDGVYPFFGDDYTTSYFGRGWLHQEPGRIMSSKVVGVKIMDFEGKTVNGTSNSIIKTSLDRSYENMVGAPGQVNTLAERILLVNLGNKDTAVEVMTKELFVDKIINTPRRVNTYVFNLFGGVTDGKWELDIVFLERNPTTGMLVVPKDGKVRAKLVNGQIEIPTITEFTAASKDILGGK